MMTPAFCWNLAQPQLNASPTENEPLPATAGWP